MKKEGLAFFTDTQWTLTALIIFFTVFMLMMIVQQMLYKKEDVKRIEQLPFEGEEQGELS